MPSSDVPQPVPMGQEPPWTAILDEVRDAERPEWNQAWFGMEPTFTNRKTLKIWKRSAKSEASEVKFFNHDYVLKMQRAVAKAMAVSYTHLSAAPSAPATARSRRASRTHDAATVRRCV